MKRIVKRWIGVISPTYRQYRDFLKNQEKKGEDTSDYIYTRGFKDIDGRVFRGYVLLKYWYKIRNVDDLIELIKSNYDPSSPSKMIELKGKHLSREEIREFRQAWEEANHFGRVQREEGDEFIEIKK